MIDKLKEQITWLELSQELAGVGSWSWTIPTNEVRWSDRMLAFWGYSQDEFMGNVEDVARRIHPEDVGAWRESVRACVEEGRPHRLEFRLVLPGGAIRWVQVLGDLIRDDEGVPFRMLGVALDVTQRKVAEKELKKSEELLNHTGEMARVGGWEVELATNTVVWTKTTRTIHEVSQDYVPTVEQALDFFPEAKGELARALERLRSEGIPYDLELPFTTAKGRKLWTRTIGRAEFEDGKCTRIHGTFQDITDKKRAETELLELSRSLERRVRERTAKLEDANRQLEVFACSVSHDLRAPLHAIMGFAEIIADQHRDQLDERGISYFDRIVQASEKMGRLMDDLLRYARLGSDGVSLVPVELDFAVHETVDALSESLRSAEAHVQVAADLPKVLADPSLLSQVLSNIIGNAVKYRRLDVPLEIGIDWYTEQSDAVLRVRDNGIGIDARFHDKIFDMFQRLHADDAIPGTGIGLAASARAVALMGGRIWVESQKGKGSTFNVALPLFEAPKGRAG